MVALTANVMAEQVAACRAAGMDGHLGKPIRTEDLFDVIASVTKSAEGQAPVASATVGSDPLAALKGRYRVQLGSFVDEFARFSALAEPDRVSAISALSHSIAGTSGSLGFRDVSAAAYALQTAASRPPADEQERSELDNLVRELIGAMNSV